MAQDLKLQTAKTTNAVCVLVSELYHNVAESNVWYGDASGKAAVVVTGQIAVEEFGLYDDGFRWI